MKSSMMALAVGAALAGCSSTGDGNVFAAKDRTVEYYRVFDIKTEPGNQAVVKAASDGISRHVSDATQARPTLAADLKEQPGRFQLAEPSGSAPGAPSSREPTCEGATWTAKGSPRVNGGDNMNMMACLFPYKNGYHLDMYAVFTKKEGGWLEWPRRLTGRFMGTPENWTDQTMADVVRSIRDATGAQVSLVEAKPVLDGMPWLEAKPAAGGNGGAGGAGAGVAGGPAKGGATATLASGAPAGTAAGATASGTTEAGATTTPVPAAAPASSGAGAPAPSPATPATPAAASPASTGTTPGGSSTSSPAPAAAPTPAAAPAATGGTGTSGKP
jgi:hypothetical protein